MDDQSELRLRRKAVRLYLQGQPSNFILRAVGRSRGWLNKWLRRFEQHGSPGLHSQSRAPHTQAGACPARIVRVIVQTRRRLVKQKVGLIGARAIRRELRKLRLGKHWPSLATIKRVLHAQGLVPTAREQSEQSPAYFPRPLAQLSGILHALDWTCKYLEGGPKVYAFHTLNLRTRMCYQTIAADKAGPTVVQHCLASWKTLGIPRFLQLDNDAAFCGGYKVPRVFGQFVRLALYVGIELIFLPVGEPECNGEIEALNGLWGRAFWERQRFGSFGRVVASSPRFMCWYLHAYAPPALHDQSPAQAQRCESRHRLSAIQAAGLPEQLPITAGRLHFLRKVAPDGTIAILNETWKVSKRLAGKYIWATIITHGRRLEVWHQRSAHHPWRLLKCYPYDLAEPVARLKPEFAHSKAA